MKLKKIFNSIKKPTKNVELEITLDSKDIKQLRETSSTEYEGRIYTNAEIDAYIREVLKYSDLPNYWRKPINGKTKLTMENLLAMELLNLINTVNLARRYNMNVYKKWSCGKKEQNMSNEETCPICEALDGTRILAEESFPSEVYVPKLEKTIKWNLVLRDKAGRTFERPVALMNYGNHLCSSYGCRCCLLFDIE